MPTPSQEPAVALPASESGEASETDEWGADAWGNDVPDELEKEKGDAARAAPLAPAAKAPSPPPPAAESDAWGDDNSDWGDLDALEPDDDAREDVPEDTPAHDGVRVPPAHRPKPATPPPPAAVLPPPQEEPAAQPKPKKKAASLGALKRAKKTKPAPTEPSPEQKTKQSPTQTPPPAPAPAKAPAEDDFFADMMPEYKPPRTLASATAPEMTTAKAAPAAPAPSRFTASGSSTTAEADDDGDDDGDGWGNDGGWGDDDDDLNI